MKALCQKQIKSILHFFYYTFSSSNLNLNFCVELCIAIEKPYAKKKWKKSIREIAIYARCSYKSAPKPVGYKDASRFDRVFPRFLIWEKKTFLNSKIIKKCGWPINVWYFDDADKWRFVMVGNVSLMVTRGSRAKRTARRARSGDCLWRIGLIMEAVHYVPTQPLLLRSAKCSHVRMTVIVGLISFALIYSC